MWSVGVRVVGASYWCELLVWAMGRPTTMEFNREDGMVVWKSRG